MLAWTCGTSVVVSIINIDNSAGGYGLAKIAHVGAWRSGPIPVRIVRAARHDSRRVRTPPGSPTWASDSPQAAPAAASAIAYAVGNPKGAGRQ